MPKAPCKDCQNRHPACHDSCEEYKKFKEEHKELQEKKREFLEKSRSVDFLTVNKTFAKKIRYRQV